MADAHPDEKVEVWFEDEARFGRKGTLTRVRAEKGSRPCAPKPGGFGNLHVLTAVCPASGRAEGLISAVRNTGVVQTFLDQLSETTPVGVRVVLVWDGAGYQSASAALRCPANRTLISLPAYAPEWNPVERRWLYLREHHGSNRTYPNVEALEDAANDGWRAVCLHPEKIKSICRCGYLTGN